MIPERIATADGCQCSGAEIPAEGALGECTRLTPLSASVSHSDSSPDVPSTSGAPVTLRACGLEQGRTTSAHHEVYKCVERNSDSTFTPELRSQKLIQTYSLFTLIRYAFRQQEVRDRCAYPRGVLWQCGCSSCGRGDDDVYSHLFRRRLHDIYGPSHRHVHVHRCGVDYDYNN
ncbi:hypothetical protein BKA93DRAFT_809615 [Sparassis latifolia]